MPGNPGRAKAVARHDPGRTAPRAYPPVSACNPAGSCGRAGFPHGPNSLASTQIAEFAGITARLQGEAPDRSITRRGRPETSPKTAQPSLLRFAQRRDLRNQPDRQSTNSCPRSPIQRSCRSSSTLRESFTFPRSRRRPSNASPAATDSRPFRIVGVKPRPVALVARLTRSSGSKTVTFLSVRRHRTKNTHIRYRIDIRQQKQGSRKIPFTDQLSVSLQYLTRKNHQKT